jgi:hypothetical protein
MLLLVLSVAARSRWLFQFAAERYFTSMRLGNNFDQAGSPKRFSRA